MKRSLCVLLLFSINSSAVAPLPQAKPQPQTQQQATLSPEQQPGQPQASPNQKFMLEDGTPVRLKLGRTVSSADAQVGDKVDFEVVEEVRIGETLVIPRGGLAWGTVTVAQRKRRLGRAGKLSLNIDSVRLTNGERAALRAVKEEPGGSNVGKMTGAIVASSILFFPAAPLFLFVSGKDRTIPKGTEVTGYINGDTPLDITTFQEASSGRPASPPGQAGPAKRNAFPARADFGHHFHPDRQKSL